MVVLLFSMSEETQVLSPHSTLVSFSAFCTLHTSQHVLYISDPRFRVFPLSIFTEHTALAVPGLT